MKAIYPGSFDPITYGHLDIIERASAIFDEVVVLLMTNDEKQGTFTMQERCDMISECIGEFKNVSVMIGSGLTVRVAEEIGATIMVRGIRAVTDYEYELQLATANMLLAPDVHTVFLVAKPQYSFLSSSTAKTIAKNNGDISAFVPPNVERRMKGIYE